MTGLLSPTHLALLLVVLLALFGARRLPELGRSLGTGMREFRDSLSGDPQELPPALVLVPDPAERPAAPAPRRRAAAGPPTPPPAA